MVRSASAAPIGRQVRDLDRRVGRGLQPDQVRTLGRREHGGGVADGHPTYGHAVGLDPLVDGGGDPEVAVGRQHDRAAPGQQLQGGVRGGHPRGEGERLATLQRADRRLQRGPGGVAVPAVPHGAARVGGADVGRREHDRRIEGGIDDPGRSTCCDGEGVGMHRVAAVSIVGLGVFGRHAGHSPGPPR